ncbi:CHASE domain-containing protein [Duganella sp. FT3S]|uniref:histidine kinase n=1 Tax=Rugamonas fusca TaxID=2758568 RepID=A0A7W2I8T0_9BURK|nr:CHASE domain-containing protein [Rugamonas fusca]MBA5607937.1 CHASE domain-containing protein [Rugamonas fusca]
MRRQGYIAFIVGLCLTAALCLFVLGEQQRQRRDVFRRDADKITHATEVRLRTYFDMLLALRAMYAHDDHIDRAEFHRFVAALDLARRYPGFQAIQFVRAVPAPQLAAYTEAVRRDTSLAPQGYPQFRIHPAALRETHYVIEYTEPLAGNENAFGLDLAALPPHLQALELGRDDGAIVATERITLVQDASGEPGFVARAPIYRNGAPLATPAQRRAALVGFVAIVFKVNTLMREVIEPGLLNDLYVRIHDTGYLKDGASQPPGPDNLLFDSGGRIGAARLPVLPGLAASTSLVVGERRWLLRVDGHAGARYSGVAAPVLLAAAAGLIISALVAALLTAKQGLERSLAELARQKDNADAAHADLSAALASLQLAQANLITSEKMASLGALVAGVAHELNTPIGNSLLTATALGDRVAEFERQLGGEGGVKRSALVAHLADAGKACTIIAAQLARAADLITSFKQVAVDQSSGQRRRFLLEEVVRDVLATFAVQLRHAACTVEVEVEAGLELLSYPGSVGQVLSNLLNNALLHGVDGGGGTVTISARRQGPHEAVLRFADNGKGMSERTLRQVFDPFFTTRLGQGGSGLGMHIVYNIVTSVLHGRIDVQSAPGQGTCVTITLPLEAPVWEPAA